MSQVSSHYPSPYDSPQMLNYAPAPPPSRKRSRQEDFFFDYPAFQQLQAAANAGAPMGVDLSGQGQAMQPSAMQYAYSSQHTSPRSSHSRAHSLNSYPQHHHGLSNPAFSDGFTNPAYGDTPPSLADEDHGPPSVVGQPGMPEPAPRPKGPKLKFVPEDDALLVELKETKNLTWKQIADFFPGRTSGTLQVRYCTKLKAKTTLWNEDLVQRLRGAVQEYESDRWRIIAGKVGNCFSGAACRDKAAELGLLDELDLTTVASSSSSASGSGSTTGEVDTVFDLPSASSSIMTTTMSTNTAVITPPSSHRESSVKLSLDLLDET